MHGFKALNRLLVLFVAMAMATVGTVVSAQPAQAAVTVRFDLNEVWGTVTFHNRYSYTIWMVIDNPHVANTPGGESMGEYFEGNARIRCGRTPHHDNPVWDSQRTYTDYARCYIANIDQVFIMETMNGQYWRSTYVDNPYT